MTATERAADGGIARDRSSNLVTVRTLMDTGFRPRLMGRRLERDLDPVKTPQPGRFAAGDVRPGCTKRARLSWATPWRSACCHRFLADLMGS
jgi:hypothetical protein